MSGLPPIRYLGARADQSRAVSNRQLPMMIQMLGKNNEEDIEEIEMEVAPRLARAQPAPERKVSVRAGVLGVSLA
jgi:hypothetical protein